MLIFIICQFNEDVISAKSYSSCSYLKGGLVALIIKKMSSLPRLVNATYEITIRSAFCFYVWGGHPFQNDFTLIEKVGILHLKWTGTGQHTEKTTDHLQAEIIICLSNGPNSGTQL